MCVTENKEMLSKEAVKVCVCLIVCYIMIQCVSKCLNILVLVKKKIHASREYSVAVGWIKKPQRCTSLWILSVCLSQV